MDLTSLESQLNVPINLTGLVSSNVAGALDDVANSLQGVVSTGNNVVEQIQRYGVRTLTNLEDNHKGQIDDVGGLLRSPTPCCSSFEVQRCGFRMQLPEERPEGPYRRHE